MPSSGGCASPALLANAMALGGKPTQLLIDATRAIMATDGGELVECDTSMCSTTIRRLAAAPRVIAPLRRDDSSIYWVEAASGNTTPLAYRVMKLAN